jgi:hypothetical protein
MRTKRCGCLTIRDRTNLIIALDERIAYVQGIVRRDGLADCRYTRYLKALRKKL